MMAERTPLHIRWANAIVLILFSWVAILLELAPLGGQASATPSPDFLFCVAACLVLRRPSTTPAALILILGIVNDLISGTPAGLGALTLLFGVEILRTYRDRLRRMSFLAEFMAVALVVTLMAAITFVVLTVVFLPTPPLDQIGLGVIGTLAAYVIITILLRGILRIRDETDDPLAVIGAAR